MTRKKVTLSWIASDSARKASFRKRKQGLVKKMRELTVLCGINAFIVIYGPDSERPVVWPSRYAVQQLLYRFQASPEMERSKKMTTQETYLKERVAKVQEQLRKQMKKNRELETDQIMFRLSQGTQLYELETDDLVRLFWMIEEKMKETQKKVEYFQQIPEFGQPSFPPHENRVDGEVGLTENRLTAMDQWFIDMMVNKKEVPGSSSASVHGTNDFAGRHVNGGSENGFTDYGGFGYNWAETTMNFPQAESYDNGREQMNADDYGLGNFGGLVNGEVGGEAAIGGVFSELDNENYGGGAKAENQETMELHDNQDNMDFGMINGEGESTGFLAGFFEGINNGEIDPFLPLDFNYSWHHIFSP